MRTWLEALTSARIACRAAVEADEGSISGYDADIRYLEREAGPIRTSMTTTAMRRGMRLRDAKRLIAAWRNEPGQIQDLPEEPVIPITLQTHAPQNERR